MSSSEGTRAINRMFMNRTKVKIGVLGVVAIMVAMVGESGASAERGVNVPGEQRRWAINFKVRLEQVGRESPVGVELTGDWVTTVSAVRAGEYDAELQIADLHLSGEGNKNAPPDASNELRRRLARPFWVTYRDDGALLKIHFFKDVDPSDANLLQMIATEVQFVRPDASQLVWTVLERDGAGSYLAIYQQWEPNVVVKRKLKYVRLDGMAGAPAEGLQVTVDQSEQRFSLDTAGRMIGLDGTNRVKIALSGPETGPGLGVSPLAATAEIHLTNLRTGRAPGLIGSLFRARQDVLSSPIVTHQADPAEMRARSDELLLEHRTTETLLEAAMTKDKDTDPMLADRLAALCFASERTSFSSSSTMLFTILFRIQPASGLNTVTCRALRHGLGTARRR